MHKGKEKRGTTITGIQHRHLPQRPQLWREAATAATTAAATADADAVPVAVGKLLLQMMIMIMV